MSIPLVQEATRDAINTSIIAIKRNIERINMLLGLVDSGSDPDLSGLATKQELQDAITELTPVDEVTADNMQSVTSNAVSKSFSYSTDEIDTGTLWYNGNKIYKKTFIYDNVSMTTGTEIQLTTNFLISSNKITGTETYGYSKTNGIFINDIRVRSTTNNALNAMQSVTSGTFIIFFTVFYTKSA